MQDTNEKYLRQTGIVKPESTRRSVLVVGAGGIGAPCTLALAKMGDFNITVMDDDGVAEWNQSSTLYGPGHIDLFKGEALQCLVSLMTGSVVFAEIDKFTKHTSVIQQEIVICAVDSMAVRWEIWKNFLASPHTRLFIDARMGGETAQIYTIEKSIIVDSIESGYMVSHEDGKFYADQWFPDSEAEEQSCTNRAIIYNTFMIASLIARAVRGYCTQTDKMPREVIFDMKNLDFMFQE